MKLNEVQTHYQSPDPLAGVITYQSCEPLYSGEIVSMNSDTQHTHRIAARNEKIENTFSYHEPKGNQSSKYEIIRQVAKGLAYAIESNIPDSREKSLALTKLEEVVMWANKGIAINT